MAKILKLGKTYEGVEITCEYCESTYQIETSDIKNILREFVAGIVVAKILCPVCSRTNKIPNH